jgi:hypothetical protein
MLISSLLMCPQGCQECQKMRQEIAPKLKNLRKSLRKQGFFDIFFFNFRSLCLFWAILAQKLNSFICKKKFCFFDTPETPGGASIVEWMDFESIRPLWNFVCPTKHGFYWLSLHSVLCAQVLNFHRFRWIAMEIIVNAASNCCANIQIRYLTRILISEIWNMNFHW